VFDGTVSCLLSEVWLPEDTSLECTSEHAGFILPPDYEQPGPDECPDGFRPASWGLGCEVAWARPPADYGCAYDELDGTFTMYWWP
jgi:hypothetical protein